MPQLRTEESLSGPNDEGRCFACCSPSSAPPSRLPPAPRDCVRVPLLPLEPTMVHLHSALSPPAFHVPGLCPTLLCPSQSPDGPIRPCLLWLLQASLLPSLTQGLAPAPLPGVGHTGKGGPVLGNVEASSGKSHSCGERQPAVLVTTAETGRTEC